MDDPVRAIKDFLDAPLDVQRDVLGLRPDLQQRLRAALPAPEQPGFGGGSGQPEHWPSLDERELMRIAYRNGFRDGSNRAAQRIGGKITALASPHWPDDEAGIDSGPGEVADTPPTPGPVQEDDAPV